MMPVRLEPAALRSRVKHSTTEPLRSLLFCDHLDGEERERELAALPSLSSWCLVIVVWLFLLVPWVCLQFVIVILTYYFWVSFMRTAMTGESAHLLGLV